MLINSTNSKAYHMKLLQTINADSLKIVLPTDEIVELNKKKKYFDYVFHNPSSTQAMYGENDLAKFPMFFGGFINFGYWKGIKYKDLPLTDQERIQSSINLYQYAFNRLKLDSNSEVLEVGSGQGNGCVLLAKQFRPKQIIGLDIVPQQTKRARHQHAAFIKDNSNIEFTTGSAENMAFPDNSFTHLISIEAASHFSSMMDFFKEAARVLKPNGMLLVATVFPKDHKSLEKLKCILPKYHVYMNDFSMDKLQIYTTHLQNLKVTSIGDYVWEGLDEWLKRDDLKKSWSRLWLKAYEAGLIDYYVIEAKN